MPRHPRHDKPAPPGCCWIDEASRLTGLAIETLYKYRQRGEGHGPRSGTIGRKAVYKLADIEAWREAQLNPEPDRQRLHNSRPPEPRIARRKAAA